MTTPFVDDMYEQLKNTLLEYEVIICRWPEYIFALENVCLYVICCPYCLCIPFHNKHLTWLIFFCCLSNFKAIADVEKAVIEALEKQYADVLAPLKDSMTPKRFGLKYVHKLAKRNSISPYTVPDEVSSLIKLLEILLTSSS